MQPGQNPLEGQQSKEQPSDAPYVANSLDTEKTTQNQPVVTLSPDQNPAEAPQVEQAESQSDDPGMQPVHWQAYEYIHHEKGMGWFFAFSLTVIIAMAAAIFLIQSWTFAILVPVMAAALLVYTHRPPRLLDYILSRQGLHINDRLYAFGEFKAFGVIRDGAEYSIMLVPTKRFRPGVTVYFPEEAGEAIVDLLGARLPMQQIHLDVIDRLVRKLRI